MVKCPICKEDYVNCPHSAQDIGEYGDDLNDKGLKLARKLQKITKKMAEFKRFMREANDEGKEQKEKLDSLLADVKAQIDNLENRRDC